MEVELRPHQELALDQIRLAIKSGHRRIMVAAPCAFGKTVLAAKIFKNLQDRDGHGIFICDRIKLVQQTIEAFDRMGVTFGVMQGLHERTNIDQTVQIASVQTLQSWQKKAERDKPQQCLINEAELAYSYKHFDVYIIDEAHILSSYIKKLMDKNPDSIFIGLSATPYSKGLGEYYDELIVPITANQLTEQGYLCPIKYYGGRSVRTDGVKSKKLNTGGTEWDAKILGENAENDEQLNGDIVKNWIKRGCNKQTIAFCASIKHSKFLVEEFNKNNIPAAHIDGYMDDELRQALYRAHDEGEIKILSCSQLLNTGYDAPQVGCLIDCYPIKSIIQYIQRAGRIMRNCIGKDFAIYLDHANNFRHGRAEDIVPTVLDNGKAKFNEKAQIKEKKEPRQHECPMCFQLFTGLSCECGYEIPITECIMTDGGDLVELDSDEGRLARQAQRERDWLGKQREIKDRLMEQLYDSPLHRNLVTSNDDKKIIFGELKGYCFDNGYEEGWACHKYRDWFGVWPNHYRDSPVLHNYKMIGPILELSRINYRKQFLEKKDEEPIDGAQVQHQAAGA